MTHRSYVTLLLVLFAIVVVAAIVATALGHGPARPCAQLGNEQCADRMTTPEQNRHRRENGR